MPEGDTVYRACERLHAALAGHVLTLAELRVPQLATVDLVGLRVNEVVARGKHQLLRLGNGLTLHTHLRMEGAWRVVPASKPWPGPDFERRVILGTDKLTCVGLRLPVTELLNTDRENEVVGHLGPDLLGPDWDLEEALRRVSAHPEATIGEALLDQRNLAGLGTFYRAELCFLQGLHPRTAVHDVPNLRRVLQRAKQVITANRDRTARSTTGNLRQGMECWVFERTRQPCRRCRTRILDEAFGPVGQERKSYWCPNCQPLRGS